MRFSEYCGPLLIREDTGTKTALNNMTKWHRDEGRTYSVTVILLIHDLVTTADFNFRFARGGGKERKDTAMRRTREMLVFTFCLRSFIPRRESSRCDYD